MAVDIAGIKHSRRINKDLRANKARTTQRTPLETLILQARAFPADSDHRRRICQRILSENLGLCATIGGYERRSSKTQHGLDYGDSMGYLWQSILKAIDEWDATKAKASTYVVNTAKNLMYDHAYKSHTIGAVRTPMRSTLYSCIRFDGVKNIENVIMESIIYTD